VRRWPGRQMTLQPSRPPHSSFRVRVLAVLLLLGSALTARVAKPQPTPVRDADAACAKCHERIYRTYLTTPMANASGPASKNLKTAIYAHKPSGVTYSISTSHEMPTLTYRESNQSTTPTERQLSYFLGSGHLGITYLYSVDNYLFESPIAWYAASQSYDMKPGLAEMRRPPPALPMESACLRCHMSAVQPSIPGTINRYQGLPFLHGGITCESCHGDSLQHLRSGGKAGIVNPAKLDADERDSVCISCHLEGDVSVEHAGRSALSYRPGESISTFLAYYVRGGANLTKRGVSEVEQLSQSGCKRASGDKMSCTSCHDPHFAPGPGQRAAFYRGKCLACHARPEFAATHHPEDPDCTSCHMRRTGAENIPHVAWTDHRILRLPEKANAEIRDAATTELTPVFSPGANKRDLAMAYYQLLLQGDRSFEPSAWGQLMDQKDSIANDPEALDALGNLCAERGDRQNAEWAFRRVLELDPVDLTALSNLGTLLAKQGKLDDAIQLLGLAFDRNRDIPGLAMNLARVECMAGNGRTARSTLEGALIYSPNLEDLQRLLEQMTGCTQPGSKH
jgi:predicted CXXCH cytochrome family protein